jgi:4-oxalocrotonate tautomerase
MSSRIAGTLTKLAVTILKKKHALTAIATDYVPSEHWFIGGKSVAAFSFAPFNLEVTVTEGTNTKDKKVRFIDDVSCALAALLGTVAMASYIVVRNVRGHAWGNRGKTQEHRYVSST